MAFPVKTLRHTAVILPREKIPKIHVNAPNLLSGMLNSETMRSAGLPNTVIGWLASLHAPPFSQAYDQQ